MRAPPRAIRITLTLLTAITLAACAKPTPTAPAPPARILPAVTELAISGVPASFSYGLSAQLKAIATLTDGTLKETLEVAAVWQSSDKSVASVSDTGLLVVTGFGDADVTAIFQNQQASAHVALPKVARLSVLIDSHGSTLAIQGVTNVTFDLSGSSGAEMPLRYAVSFGDGDSSESSDPVLHHIYDTVGDYVARATVTDRSRRADSVTHKISVGSLLRRTYDPSGGGGACWTYWEYWDGRKDGTYLRLDFDTHTGARVGGRYTTALSHNCPTEPSPCWSTRFSGVADQNDNVQLSLDNGTILTGPIRAIGAFSSEMELQATQGPLAGPPFRLTCHDPY